MIRKVLKKCAPGTLLIFVSFVLSWGLAEAGLRIFGISYPVFETFDSERGKSLKPGKKGWYRKEGEAYIEINSAGFRDVEHVHEKPNGTYRVAVLGDSYVEARQVALEDTFVKQMEEKLNQCPNNLSQRIEVLNFGVSGYGTAVELLTLRTDVWAYDPDLVVLAFFSGNDLTDNSPRMVSTGDGVTRVLKPFFYLEDEKLKLDQSFRNWSPGLLWVRFLMASVHYSRVLEVVNQARRVFDVWKIQRDPNQAVRAAGLSDFIYRPPLIPAHQEAWEVTEAILTMMHNEVVERDKRFLLVTLTNPDQVDPNQRRVVKRKLGVERLDYPEKRLRQLGEKRGFQVRNLLYGFQEYADNKNVALHGFQNHRLGFGHWNENGHRVAAILIAGEICNNETFW